MSVRETERSRIRNLLSSLADIAKELKQLGIPHAIVTPGAAGVEGVDSSLGKDCECAACRLAVYVGMYGPDAIAELYHAIRGSDTIEDISQTLRDSNYGKGCLTVGRRLKSGEIFNIDVAQMQDICDRCEELSKYLRQQGVSFVIVADCLRDKNGHVDKVFSSSALINKPSDTLRVMAVTASIPPMEVAMISRQLQAVGRGYASTLQFNGVTYHGDSAQEVFDDFMRKNTRATKEEIEQVRKMTGLD